MLRRLLLQSHLLARRTEWSSHRQRRFMMAGLFRHSGGKPPRPGFEDENAPEERSAKDLSADDMEFYNMDSYQIHHEEETEDEKEERLREEESQRIRDELDAKTGRGWTPDWEMTDDDWASRLKYHDAPDWKPEMASRISVERVKVYENGIPTLSEMAKMPIPPPPPPHPGVRQNGQLYSAWRRRRHQAYVAEQVKLLAAPRIETIRRLTSWEAKQDAVDELFESVEFEMRDKEVILGKHPLFGGWVEASLEQVLQEVNQVAEEADDSNGALSSSDAKEEGDQECSSDAAIDVNGEEDDAAAALAKADETAVPIFIDLYNKDDKKSDEERAREQETDEDDTILDSVDDAMVPTILHPLQTAHHEKVRTGRMVEEWELAVNRKTKRIMMRESTRRVAQTLVENESSRVYITGPSGIGKSAALSLLVASARQSGWIVLYLADGDRLRKHGYYIEPNNVQKGLFDTPRLSQEVCVEILESHEKDLEGFEATDELLASYMDEALLDNYPTEEFDKDDLSLITLLKLGKEYLEYAPMCLSAVLDVLKNQTETPFMIAMDSFNCYYDHGYYFHMDYSENFNEYIPCNQISFLRPGLDAMGVSRDYDDEEPAPVMPRSPIKRGAVVVATTEGHAVKDKFTQGLRDFCDAVEREQKDYAGKETVPPLVVVDIPRLSKLEVEHTLSNYELIGIGRLRFDRGYTVMNENELQYFRMVSGAIPQKLLDAVIK